MNDNQFEALLVALDRLTKSVDILANSLVADAGMIHDDLQDIVSSVDCHGRAVDELVDTLRGYKSED